MPYSLELMAHAMALSYLGEQHPDGNVVFI